MPKPLTGEAWINSRQKHTFDILATAAIIPVLAPATVLGATAFFIETGVNPLFVQRRSGRNEKPLDIYKLRSMAFSGDFYDGSNGHCDERASRVGRILRKLTLDEAPQVINILLGQMSVVGPRPLIKPDIERTLDLLNPKEQSEWRRACTIARPGWMSDFGNASRFIEPQSEEYLLTRVEKDCEYLASASYAKDVQIISDALAIGKTMVHG